MDQYRVFISYSHEDQALTSRIVDVLKENGLTPMWDQDFAYGHGFPEQIKDFITYSHVFLPVITEAATNRGWVHQEIGYAIALNVPVLPVMLGTLPSEMIRELHGIQLPPDGKGLKSRLSTRVFHDLISRYSDASLAPFVCADLHEDRTIMMVRYAEDVLRLGATGLIRQKGALSSFHIPDDLITRPIWRLRYGPFPKGDYHCRLQRSERIALEKHARQSGCRLILNPDIEYEQYGTRARLVRLETLVRFLEDMPDDKLQIVFNPEMHQEESLTIVGSWFAATSVAASIVQGYRQTIFTRHAPTMQTRIELFDRDFDELLQASKWSAESSRARATEELKAKITVLRETP